MKGSGEVSYQGLILVRSKPFGLIICLILVLSGVFGSSVIHFEVKGSGELSLSVIE